MNLYLVRNDSGEPIWIAHEDNEMRIWTYVHNTGKFHLNQGLYRDFYFEHANTYTPISVDEALQHIQAGIGKLDERTVGHLVKRFRADPAAREIEDVLGSAPVPTVRQQAAARARALENASIGAWVTWKTYRPEQRQLALVAANDIRNGKIRMLTAIGPVDARVENEEDHVNVLVARR